MLTQTKDQKLAKLEALVLEMGQVIRTLDEEHAYCRLWTADKNDRKRQYGSSLRNIIRYPIMDKPIKVIMVIEEGHVKALHATTDFQYVVVDVDPESKDPVVIGNINTPDTVDTNLSLRTINIDLEGSEDYGDHPWK